MFRRIAIAVTIAVGFIAAGCAPVNPQQTSAQDDPVYSTGTHLPRRAGGGGASTVTTTSAPTPDQAGRQPACVGGQACGGGK
jgi:hypothetical protein